MPIVNRKDNGLDISINYEVAGQGEPLVMHHGNGNCINDWKTLGFVEQLSPHFQLIMIDSRGYGKSSKPHSPNAYSLKSRADDTIAVLDTLGVQQAHCFGVSIAGCLCFILTRFYPERFKSYILATPYFELYNDGIKSALSEGIESFINHLEDLMGARLSNEAIRKTFLANDPKALIAANSSEWFNVFDYTKYIKVPTLIYEGEKETVSIKTLSVLSEALPDNRLVILAGLDHVQAHWNSEVAAPLIIDFIDSLRNK